MSDAPRPAPLVRSLFKKRYRTWLARFAALLEDTELSADELEQLFAKLESRDFLAALLQDERLSRVAEALAGAPRATPEADIATVCGLAARLARGLGGDGHAAHAVGRLLDGLATLSPESVEDLAQAAQALGAPPAAEGEAGLRLLARAVAEAAAAPQGARALPLLDKMLGLLKDGAPDNGAPENGPSENGAVEEVFAALERAADLVASTETRGLVRSLLDLVASGTPSLRKGLSQMVAQAGTQDRAQEYHLVPDIYGRNYHLLRDIREEAPFKESAEAAVRQGLSLLYYDRLYNLYEALANVCRLHPGEKLNAAEIGVYQGGTSYFVCDLLRKLHAAEATFFAIDTFEGHSALDLPRGEEGLHSPKMFAKTSAEQVGRLLAEFPFAAVIKGRIQDCAAELEPLTFHFVHLDVDIYEPMAFSLKLFLPRLAAGGVICVDDYNKTSCPGVRQAVDEAVASFPRPVMKLYTQTAQCLLIATGQTATGQAAAGAS